VRATSLLLASLLGGAGCIQQADNGAAARAKPVAKAPAPPAFDPPPTKVAPEAPVVAPPPAAVPKKVLAPDPNNPRARFQSKRPEASLLKTGDIIFVAAAAPHAKAAAAAMPGEFNHCGIIFVTSDGPQVMSADVKLDQRPYDQWLRIAGASRIVIKRLTDPTLVSPENIRPLQIFALSVRGNAYDFGFDWESDLEMYGSEFVHKAFAKTGVELGTKQTLAALGLDADRAKKLTERHGAQIALDGTAVTPTSIFDDARLELVFDSAT